MNPPRPLARAYFATSITLAITFAITPCAAFAALGSVDPATGASNLGTWLWLLGAGIVPCIFFYKGVHAMAQGEQFGRHVFGLVAGLAVMLGGAAISTHWGGG